MIPLSPDLVARAVIAAARVYGDNPLAACTSKRGQLRRSLKAAAMGLHGAIGGDLSRFATVLKIQDKNLYHARRTAKTDDRIWVAAAKAELVVRGLRGDDAPTDPVRVPRPAGPDKLNAIVAVLLPKVPLIVARHPEGASVAQIVALTGLEPSEAARGAAHLHVRHKCRWARTPNSKGKRVMLAWTEPGAPVPTPAPEPEEARVEPGGCAPPVYVTKVAPRSLRDRILGQLAVASVNSPSLAILCDAKELAVIEALRGLETEGLVERGPMTSTGRRGQTWRMKKEKAA